MPGTGFSLVYLLYDFILAFPSIPTLSVYRRERNRLHAKMTRDRKKCFLFNIQREIDELEKDNEHLRQLVEPITIAAAAAVISPELTSCAQSKARPTPHGFVLDDA
jgi:Basic region leucine zipper